MNLIQAAVQKRPTETVTGIALAGSIYGLLTKAGLDPAIAAVIAVAIAFAPAAVSEVVDAVRR
ncbi:MAG TPA: hypothetical protein VFK14_00130 [Solirubrobacterales bacterium]|nr:hypothetical protein [Solirubrobacterales bacterium]